DPALRVFRALTDTAPTRYFVAPVSDTVAMHPQHQGTGVGRALFQFAGHEAVRRGCDSLFLCTNLKMTGNRAIYPRIRYVEFQTPGGSPPNGIYFRKALRRALGKA
ncbi:MAG TPA: GNAT family N-acetyltransferase, partial [Candidatus Limnocylindria bacterium]|nr:GNAT family N-acetyltransferase [Candidatus Limnocylindria bacterium]